MRGYLFAGGGVLLCSFLLLLLDQAAVVPTLASWSSSGLRPAGGGTSMGHTPGSRNLVTQTAGGAILDRNRDDVGECILIFFGVPDRGEW